MIELQEALLRRAVVAHVTVAGRCTSPAKTRKLVAQLHRASQDLEAAGRRYDATAIALGLPTTAERAAAILKRAAVRRRVSSRMTERPPA